MKLPSPCYCH